MLVQHILDGKPKGIVTVEPTASVAEAAAVLSARKIGALIVSGSGEDLRGILSERDIVRELGSRGTDCLGDEVRDREILLFERDVRIEHKHHDLCEADRTQRITNR